MPISPLHVPARASDVAAPRPSSPISSTWRSITTGKRHGFHALWKVGFDGDGKIRALEATLTADGGWSLDLSEPVQARALCHIDNAYWVPHIEVHGRIAKTNKTSQTAFRGFGGPQGLLGIERVMDHIAAELKLDPLAVRQANFYDKTGQQIAGKSKLCGFDDKPTFQTCSVNVKEVKAIKVRAIRVYLSQKGNSLAIAEIETDKIT